MAKRVTVALEDDLDGGPADQAVRFGFGGAEYEIDLSDTNASAFRNKLAPSSTTPARPGGDSLAPHPVPPPAVSVPALSGLGERARHRGQCAWAYRSQRDGAVRNRYQKALTQTGTAAGREHR